MVESNQQIQFTARDLQNHLSSKEAMYEFLLRMDYFLPDKNASICTMFFLTGAYEDLIYVPRQKDVPQAYRLSCPPN